MVRKFLFSGTFLSALFGVVGVVQTTRKGPKDWRLVLTWVGWGLTMAVAIGTVMIDAQDSAELEN